MEYLGVVLVAAVVFLLCFLVDKGFAKLFRSQAQHKSGTAIRLNKKYGAAGLILITLGIAALITLAEGWILKAGGALVVLVGVCLIVYYISFGVFYDEETFLVSGFGKKNRVYRYADIAGQQLYNSYGQILIELQMEDGKTVQLQGAMPGVYPFLDHAFAAWCRQKGIQPESCSFHDTENSCWFPTQEEN